MAHLPHIIPMKQPSIAVIGAGIIGLSCAVELYWAGYKKITLFAEKLTPHTTSDIAAALWMPYKAHPENLINQWCKNSLITLNKLFAVKEAGISWTDYTELYQKATPLPLWMNLVERKTVNKLPSGYHYSYTVKVPIIHSAFHLPYLMQILSKAQIQIQQKKISAINHLTKQFDIIINCSGLGARELVDDTNVFPIRGQMVVFSKTPALNYSIAELGENLTCVIPRSQDCMVGGTIEENNWDLQPDPEASRLMIERATAICPELKTAEIIDVKTGLRPGRNKIRLEAEKIDDSLVIHNYGHGGAGYTLAWGCAADVKTLVNNYVHPAYG